MKILTKAIFILALASGLLAQQPAKGAPDQPVKKEAEEIRPLDTFYKLTFVIYELDDGKRVNQRDYSMIGRANTRPDASIRISTRIPVYSEEKKMTYVDAGLTLSCNLRDQTPGKIQAQCEIGISGFVRPEQLPESRSTGVSAPVLRSTNSNTWAVLTMGKPVIIANIDDINSAKRMQIEVTATKME
jgi:hypothetical protein